MNKPDSHTPETVTLRYSRAERLKNAPESVRKMYEPDYIPQYGILKGLTATRPLRMVLFSIILCVLLLFFFMFVRLDRTSGSYAGIPVKLETLQQGALLYTNISFAEKKRPVSDEPTVLSITVTVYNEKNASLKQEKTIQAVYIGSALTVPFQYTGSGYTRVRAAVSSGHGELLLTKNLQ